MAKLDMYSNDNHNKPKNSKDVVQHSIIHMLNRVWRNSPISDHGKKTDKAGKTNNHLLDIGKEMKNVIGQENIFYEDQQTTRECRLSEENEKVYEITVREESEALIYEERREEEEIFFINSPEFNEHYSPSPCRVLDGRTLMKLNTSDLHETTEEQVSSNSQPEIQKVNNFLPHLKDAIATMIYKAAMSTDKTRAAVQATCKKTYGHLNYIKKEEQRKYEPHLERIDEVDEERNDESSEPKTEKPRYSEVCKNY